MARLPPGLCRISGLSCHLEFLESQKRSEVASFILYPQNLYLLSSNKTSIKFWPSQICFILSFLRAPNTFSPTLPFLSLPTKFHTNHFLGLFFHETFPDYRHTCSHSSFNLKMAVRCINKWNHDINLSDSLKCQSFKYYKHFK